MTVRTTASTVEFLAPFTLEGDDEALPAGIYHIDTDEEAFEVMERVVYRRTETRLRIQTVGKVVHRRVDPVALNAAVARDREISAGSMSPDREVALNDGEAPTLALASARSSSPSLIGRVRSWLRMSRSRGGSQGR